MIYLEDNVDIITNIIQCFKQNDFKIKKQEFILNDEQLQQFIYSFLDERFDWKIQKNKSKNIIKLTVKFLGR